MKVRPQGPTGLKVSRMEVIVDIVLVVLLVLVPVSEMRSLQILPYLHTYRSRDFHPILFHFIPHPLVGIVESLQSHMILTMSHWSSGLTCLLPVTRDTGSKPQGGIM